MFEIILNPIKAIEYEKKNRNTGKTFGKIIVGSTFVGIATFIVSMVLTNDLNSSLIIGIAFILTGFIGNLVNAWIYNIAINTITGKGTYMDTLASLANSLLIIGLGFMLSMLLWLIPQAGIFLTIMLLIITFILAYSVLVKSLMTFTGADLLSIIIGLGIIIFASLLAAYLIAAITAMQTTINNPSMLGTNIQF